MGESQAGDVVRRRLSHLLITGPDGSGKSAVATALALQLAEEGAAVAVVSTEPHLALDPAGRLAQVPASAVAGVLALARSLAERRRYEDFTAEYERSARSAHVVVLDACLDHPISSTSPLDVEDHANLARLLQIGADANVWVVATARAGAVPSASFSHMNASFEVLAIHRDFDGHGICTEMRLPGHTDGPVLVQMRQVENASA